jgi:hypothetical protein
MSGGVRMGKMSNNVLNLHGFADAPIRDGRLASCRFENIALDNVVENVDGLVMNQVGVTRRGA